MFNILLQRHTFIMFYNQHICKFYKFRIEE